MSIKTLSTLILSFAATVLFAQIKTPAPSPLATVSQAIGLAKVSIEYSRPSMKGRKIFGELVPFDKVWRTGANKITSIRFDKELTFNGQKLKPGSYGWYTIPGKTEWTIAFNSEDQKWGAYEYDEKKDVLRLKVKPEVLKAPVEHLTIEFDNFTPTAADLVLSWELTAVRLRVEHDAHPQIMAMILMETNKPDANADTYSTAAEYYLDKNIELPKALEWANKALETDKNWWSYYLRADAASRLKQCDLAAADAKIALEGATKDKDTAYIKKCNAVLAKCGKK